MTTNEVSLILNIFSSDEDLYMYCDPEYLIEGKKISVKIYKRIQEALNDYPNSYYLVDYKNKWFIGWIFSHGMWILTLLEYIKREGQKKISWNSGKRLKRDMIVSYVTCTLITQGQSIG